MGIFDKVFGKKKEGAGAPVRSIVCAPRTMYAPVKGHVIPLAEVEDPAFASGMLGQGVGVEPEDDCLYASADGELTVVFPTGHAVGMKTADGMEILLHIGIDTVEAKGDGFQICRQQGEQVKAGELLVRFDRAKLRAAGYKMTVMVLVTNADELGTVKVSASGDVEVLEELYCF